MLPMKWVRYFLGQYLGWVSATLVSLFFIIGVADLVEQFRRTSAHEGLEGLVQLKLVMHKLPTIGVTLIPFILLIGSTIAFLRIGLFREYLVLRSAGMSLYRFMLPFTVVTLLTGYGIVYLYHPFATTQFMHYQTLDKQIMGTEGGEANTLWLKQATEDGYMFIHLEQLDTQTGLGKNASFYAFSKSGQTLEEWSAPMVQLDEGHWILSKATKILPLKASEAYETAKIETMITLKTLTYYSQQSESVSVRQLPTVIQLLKDQGFSSTRYEVRYYGLLFLPFFYLGLVWCAGGLSLGVSTRQSVTPVIFMISLIGFGLYLMRDFSIVLANTQKIPALWGGLCPALASLWAGVGMMLKGEGH